MNKTAFQRISLNPVAENRLLFRLRRVCCSEPWVEHQIRDVIGVDRTGRPIVIRFHNPHVFPPGGRQTRMRWCRTCGRFTPAPAVHLIERREHRSGPVVSATLECDDCRIGDDEERYRELYNAGLHLRPAGSKSCVGAREKSREWKEG